MSDIKKKNDEMNIIDINNNENKSNADDSSNKIKDELNSEIDDNAIEELLILKQTIEEKNEIIEKIKKENEENKDLLIRMKADFENYKKRVREEQKDMVKFANQRLITDLLPIIDDFDRAISSVTDEIKNTSFYEGLCIVIKSFHNLLEKKYFLEKIDEKDVAFDPNYHEAISVIEDGNTKGMTIDKILQSGYKIESRILRTAKVVVRKGVENSQKNNSIKDLKKEEVDGQISDDNQDEIKNNPIDNIEINN